MRGFYAIDKSEALSYPTHFLKSKGIVNRNSFLEYRTKQATLFSRRNDFMHCSLQVKQNTYSKGIFRASVVTQFIVKVQRQIEKSPIFESLPFLYQSTFSKCKGVSRASSDVMIYFDKN